jgi:molecular chaperone DnaJ
LRSSGRGDLLIHVEVETPAKLDERQEELLRELAALRGEERPTLAAANGRTSRFSKIREAFGPR